MPDQEDIRHQIGLLEIYRRNLAHFLKQAAFYGGEDAAPIAIANSLEDVRKNVARIKGILRGWGEQIEDYPDDEVPAAPKTPAAATTPATTATASKPKKPRRRSDGPDVYISYSNADEAWVSDTLLPRLEAAGLNVIIDYRDFEIGLPKLVNIERAVERSRHTLIVMTPEWLNSDWNAFQGLLASTDDPSGLQQKLIPLMLKACKPPAWIAMLESLDLTNLARREAQMERLVRSLMPKAGNIPNTQTAKPDHDAGAQTSVAATDPVAAKLSERDRVDFVIITALEEERDAVLSKLPGYRRHAPSNDDIRIYYSAQLRVTFSDDVAADYHIVVLTLLGMGRVQAAAAASDSIRRWHPRYVLFVGIAGGISERGVKLGDVLVSDQIVDYELQKVTVQGPQVRWETHRTDPRLLAAASDFPYALWKDLIAVERPSLGIPKRHIGPIATGDKVIAFKDVLDGYRSAWPKLIGVEMEAGGAATAAFQSAEQPGFFMIRGVSDLADENKGTDTVEQWRAYACDVAAAYAIVLLKNGPVPLGTKS